MMKYILGLVLLFGSIFMVSTLISAKPTATFAHTCRTLPIPVKNSYTTYFDTAPTNYICNGVMDFSCFEACRTSWLVDTAAARGIADSALQACEETRYAAVLQLYSNYITCVGNAQSTFDHCISLGISTTCEDDYCAAIDACAETYRSSCVAPNNQFEQCFISVVQQFNTATATATTNFNNCAANCCTN